MTNCHLIYKLRKEKVDFLIKKIEDKLKENNYYIEQEVLEIRSIINMSYSKTNNNYKKIMSIIYDRVAKEVYNCFQAKGKDFTIIDYFYITNIDPICLLKLYKHHDNKINYSAILTQLLPYPSLMDRLLKYNVDANYTMINYQINNKIFDKNDILKIMKFIDDEGLPHYEIVITELLKKYALEGSLEYRRKNKENNFVLSKKRV